MDFETVSKYFNDSSLLDAQLKSSFKFFLNYLKNNQENQKKIIDKIQKKFKNMDKSKPILPAIRMFSKNTSDDDISRFFEDLDGLLDDVKDYVEEIKEKISKKTSEESSEKEFEKMIEAFECKIEEGYFLKHFQNHLKKCTNTWIRNEAYAPILPICQSSGHGKTRCLKETSKIFISNFVCLRAMDTIGVPGRSKLADSFISSMNDVKSAIDFFYSYSLAALQTVSDIKTRLNLNNRDLKASDLERVSTVYFEYQPWLYYKERNLEYEKYDQFIQTLNEDLKVKDRDQGPYNAILIEKFETIMRNETLFFFIDEAKILLEASEESSGEEQLSRFRVMRRAIRFLFENIRVMFILTDTNTKIANFISTKYTISASEKSGLPTQSLDPYFKILFTDLLVPSNYMTQLRNPTYKFLLERDPYQTVFHFGRPLWSSFLKQNYGYTMNMAKRKILMSEGWDKLDSDIKRKMVSLAIFSMRTSLAIEYGQTFGQELVANYMATLFHINLNSEELSFKYLSEPILSEVCAELMKENEPLKQMLNYLHSYVKRLNSNATGYIGEIVAEIILLLANDRAHDYQNQKKRLNKLYSEPITVYQFLASLIGETKFNSMENKDLISSDILKALVCFTHFIQKLDNVNYESTCIDFLGRCAAGQFKAYQENFDLFIPIILENNEVSYLFFQIKNRKSNVTNSDIKILTPSKCFFKNNRIQPYLIILMSLGNENSKLNVSQVKLSSNQSQTCILIQGLDNFDFIGKQIRKALRKLLDSNRNCMNEDIYDPNVLKRVAIGHYSSRRLNN
jgi:hypothetical protein